MSDHITPIWEGLRNAGLPEVMLYLADGSAYRCHWDETVVIEGVRVALLGDQERNIVRIVPLADCAGIGISSPKGVNPTGYRSVVKGQIELDPYDESIVELEGVEPYS